MPEEKDLDELKIILGNLYIKYRDDDDVLKLSQWTDKLIVKIQKSKLEREIGNVKYTCKQCS